MKATDFGMNCRGIIIFLALLYQPKKKTSLSAYGDSDTNAIYRNARKQFINVNIKMYIFDHLRMYIFAILPLDRYIFSIDRIFP